VQILSNCRDERDEGQGSDGAEPVRAELLTSSRELLIVRDSGLARRFAFNRSSRGFIPRSIRRGRCSPAPIAPEAE